MNHRSPLLRRLPALAVVALLSGCGGGSARGPGLPAGTSTTEVLVEVEEPGDLDEIAEETGATVLGPVPGTPYYLVSLPEGADLEEFLDELDDDVRVVNADPDLGIHGPEGEGSTLPFLGSELATLVPSQPELLRIGADAARSRASGAGVRIAVLDTGVDASHPLLLGRVDADGWDLVDGDPDPSEARNGLDDDGDGRVDEGFGHGTFVASLVLALAPEARIVPFRVLNTDCFGQASHLAAAITMAADRGVRIVNLSAGMSTRVKVVEDAIAAARERGVWVVSAAGNTGREDVVFPAALSSTESVTAVGREDRRPGFASYGSEVDLCAPGVDLLGAFPGGNGTARWSGTSFSAAIVSGALALLMELHPGRTAEELLGLLEDTAFDVDPFNPISAGRLGEGRVDLEAATDPLAGD